MTHRTAGHWSEANVSHYGYYKQTHKHILALPATGQTSFSDGFGAFIIIIPGTVATVAPTSAE